MRPSYDPARRGAVLPQKDQACPLDSSHSVSDILRFSPDHRAYSIAEQAGRDATAAAQERFSGSSLHNGPGDAWRHFDGIMICLSEWGEQTLLWLPTYTRE
jgi:hypothetical protein